MGTSCPPLALDERQTVIILRMQHTSVPSLPGILAPPEPPTNYLVFISQKQWKRDTDAIKHLEGKLIIEGSPIHHPRFSGITMYATQVTTRLLQAAKRQPPAATSYASPLRGCRGLHTGRGLLR